MKIKKFKFLLYIPIACSFVSFLRGQDCSDALTMIDRYNFCRNNITHCLNECAECKALSQSRPLDCEDDCDCNDYSTCNKWLDAYNACRGNNTGGNNNTGLTNTGSTNTGSTNTGSTNTGGTNTGGTNTGENNGVAGSPCCPEGYSESDGNCCNDDECTPAPSNCDKIKQTITDCPTIPAESINSESVEYIEINDGQCCFNGGTRLPKCECDNPPTAGQCGSGYVLDGACCVMECSVPTEKRYCNRSGWDWNDSKCKCECNPNKGCCGVQLNVPLPFIGDCIEMTTNNSTAGSRTGSISVNQLNAFPVLVKGISKILVTLIMIFSIIVVIVAGLMMTTSVASKQNYETGLEYLKKVLISLILLGTSGLILKLINPSFFGG